MALFSINQKNAQIVSLWHPLRVLLFFPFATLIIGLFFPHHGYCKIIDGISASVNKDVILFSDIKEFYQTFKLRKEIDPVLGFDESFKKEPFDPEKVLEFLIQERLILQTFKVSNDEIDQEIQSVLKNARVGGMHQLEQFLTSQGFFFRQYRALMEEGLSKRTLIDRELRSRVNIGEDDLKAEFYRRASKNPSINLEYKIQLIVIGLNSYTSVQEAQTTAERTHRLLMQGSDFAEIARKFSTDSSRNSGGVLEDYLPAREYVEPVQHALHNMQIGEISKILRSKEGYIVFKLLDAKTGESSQFLQEKEKIRENLAQVEYRKQLYLWAERSKNDAFIKINGIDRSAIQ